MSTSGGTSDTTQFTWNTIGDKEIAVWDVSGTKTITVTAVNACSSVTHSRTIDAGLDEWYVYLPLAMRNR